MTYFEKFVYRDTKSDNKLQDKQKSGTILVIKGTMDGLISIALTGSYGVGVGFSILPVLIYQGGLSLLASVLASGLSDPATDPRVMVVTGVGGVMILGLGFNLLEVAKVRVASFLPALLLAPIFYVVAVWVTNGG